MDPLDNSHYTIHIFGIIQIHSNIDTYYDHKNIINSIICHITSQHFDIDSNIDLK